MGVVQLDIYGGSTDHAQVGKRGAPFSPCQQEIIRTLRTLGSVTSKQAGRIVHAHRDPACRRCQHGYCEFASSDGNEAMKRLMERGLVRRHRPGVWIAR